MNFNRSKKLEHDIQEKETEKALRAMNDVISFLNDKNTRVELADVTMIGKKYIATNGDVKKVIDVTFGNTMITHFKQDNFYGRDVVYHEASGIKSKVKVMQAKLEKGKRHNNVFSTILNRIKNRTR